MNCQEYRDMLASDVEGLLDPSAADQLHEHLAACDECRAAAAHIAQITGRIRADASALGNAEPAQAAMDRILRTTTHQLRRQIMIKRILRAAGGLVAAAAVAITATLLMVRTSPVANATAMVILADAVKATSNLKSVHMVARMRSLPREDIEMIGPDYDFIPIEMWKQFEPIAKWHIEKPGRVINMDGKEFVTWVQPSVGFRHGPVQNGQAFWLARLLDVDRVLDHEQQIAKREKAKVSTSEERGDDGKRHLLVTVESKAQGDFSKSDWMKNKTLSQSDSKSVYRFDPDTKRLEGVDVWLHADGKDVLIFQITKIEYDAPIDDKLFTLDLPTDMRWLGEEKASPLDAKYAKMTPKEIAAAFFDALAQEKWDDVNALMGVKVDDRLRFMGGLKVVSLGEPFKSGLFPGWFVPYEIQLKNGETRKFNLSVRNDNEGKRWRVDGGL